jgi:tetratricopeptide (TPR) repeat protein
MKDNPSQQYNNDIQALIALYQQLKAGHGGGFLDEDAFEKIIDYYADAEQLPLAIEVSEMGATQFPYSSTLQFKRADLLIANRCYRQALEILDKAALLDSRNIDLYILKTDAYLALDMQEKAMLLLENALDLFEGDEKLDLLFELTDVYDDYEEFDKLFDCLKMILAIDPTNEEALYKVCFWTDFTGRNEESIALHQQIIDEHPYTELAWFNLGSAYQGLKLYERSIDAYLYAIAIDEKFDYAYRNLGDAYLRIRKYKEAIEALEKVIELSRPEDVIYEAIGYCYGKMKNHAQARFFYRKASHLSPSDTKLMYKIAQTYIKEQQWLQAIKHLELAISVSGTHPDYSLAMGECKLQLGEIKEAIHHFSRVVTAKPNSVADGSGLLKHYMPPNIGKKPKHK